eukprot:SAG31_NODE_4525_length_3165_cov_1.986301_4_plen_153_part_00
MLPPLATPGWAKVLGVRRGWRRPPFGSCRARTIVRAPPSAPQRLRAEERFVSQVRSLAFPLRCSFPRVGVSRFDGSDDCLRQAFALGAAWPRGQQQWSALCLSAKGLPIVHNRLHDGHLPFSRSAGLSFHCVPHRIYARVCTTHKPRDTHPT